MIRIFKQITGFFLLALVLTGGTAMAQTGQYEFDLNANVVRSQFQRVLKQYPPSFGEVLRLDPSLLNNRDYLKPYPGLTAFLDQHPEISRNPTFFLGEARMYSENYFNRPEERAAQMRREIMQVMAVFVMFVTVASVLTWIIKTVIDHRRWLRMTTVQTDAHSKLLDRLTSNEDLLAYVQTPAGQRFLQSAPLTMEAGIRTAAPLNRILWSVQVGVILSAAGIGLQFAGGGGGESEVAYPFYVMGVLALAVGIGFIISALVSYSISRRMGLLNEPAATQPPS